MTDINRLRKLAGIKPKSMLTESDRGLGTHSFGDPDSQFSLGKSPAKSKKVGDRVSGEIKFGPYKGQTLTGTIVRLFPVSYAEVEWDNGYTSNANVLDLDLVESIDMVESTDEYDIGKPTDTYGQFKAKTPEPDYPVDMGDNFNVSTDVKVEVDDVEDEVEEEPSFSAPEEEADIAYDDFDKNQVKEARRFYNLKRLVRSNISEDITDFGTAFMASMQVFENISQKLIVEHNINLTPQEEHKIAKAVAKECVGGKSTLQSISEAHGVTYRTEGNDYIFEFADKALAMIFINEVNGSGNCIGRLRYNRGFVEAIVRDFEGK